MDCEPLDLRTTRTRESIRPNNKNVKRNFEEEKLDSGYKSSDLDVDCRSVGFDSMTDKFQRDLTLHSQCTKVISDERYVSVDEGYSSESLKSGELEKLSLDNSWKPSESSHPIKEEPENNTTKCDNVDSFVEEIFTPDVDGDT